MRKRIIGQGVKDFPNIEYDWLDLEKLAEVEISSEDAAYPIDSALLPDNGPGWRAAHPGGQTIRLLFAETSRIGVIHLVFEEIEQERTQEFVLGWSGDCGQTYRKIVRRQFNFRLPGMTRKVEDYVVNLDGVTAIELIITPDINGSDAYASLKEFRLA